MPPRQVSRCPMGVIMRHKKKCENPECKQWFVPEKDFQHGCCPECQYAVALIKLAEKRKKDQQAMAAKKREQLQREKADRKQLQLRKAALKTRADWIKDVQHEFNRYIRLRDADQPCISCGETNPPLRHGGAWDCGHYLSVGSHPELRFEPLNAHKQCKSCNAGAGKYASKNHTVSQQYRENLIRKIGLCNVELLEGPHEAKHYTIEQLKILKEKFKALSRELEKQQLAECF